MMSPQIATSRHLQAPAAAADGQRVEQRLGRMLVLAVARLMTVQLTFLRQEIDAPRLGVAHPRWRRAAWRSASSPC